MLDVPISLLDFAGAQTVIFRGPPGLDSVAIARAHVFIEQMPQEEQVFVVPDTSSDPRFDEHPLVVGPPFVRFFAGVRLYDAGREPFAVFCVMDTEPRIFRAREMQTFEGLALMATDIHTLSQLERQVR